MYIIEVHFLFCNPSTTEESLSEANGVNNNNPQPTHLPFNQTQKNPTFPSPIPKNAKNK